MSESIVEYNFCTGRPTQVVTPVLRRISAYTRIDRVSYFKIGITNNPVQRFKRAYSDYDKLIAVYRTSSINNVRDMEKLLINHNAELADNIRGGGAGNFGDPPYYLYVVVEYL